MMKKWLIGLMVMVLLLACSISIYAKHNKFDGGPGKFYGPPGHFQERKDAGFIIHRTAVTIFGAQRAADHGHHYLGLGQAVSHQQKARELYEAGYYREAIYHSLRARDIAFQIMAANREKPRHEYYRDETENNYGRNAPKDKELDIRIDSVKVGKDDAVVHLHFGLDINQ
jgi:hypothetical protein